MYEYLLHLNSENSLSLFSLSLYIYIYVCVCVCIGLFSMNAVRLIKMRAVQTPSDGTLEGTIAKGPGCGIGGK